MTRRQTWPRLWISTPLRAGGSCHTKPPLAWSLTNETGLTECDNAELPTAFLREL